MRILDRYILSRFVFNFFSSFVILMFIFIFQTIWLFIDDLAGKGLDIIIIGKFLFYLMPDLTEKVLPLTVLLSSILTFGTFAESYEFAAMKASGISLQRSMLSLIIFVTILGCVTFFFANNVIPLSQRKIYNLRKNIAKVKPAAAVTEGIFSDFEAADMNIKVDQKYGDNDRFLKNVIIHEKSKTNVNTTVIKAKSGELISSEDSDILQLVLTDGYYHKDAASRNSKNKLKYPFVLAHFDTYTMNIDLSELNNVDMEEERDISTAKMKNITRLSKDIDSIRNDNFRIVRAFSKNIRGRMGMFVPIQLKDTATAKNKEKIKKDTALTAQITKNLANKEKRDSLKKNILHIFPEWQRIQIMSSANNTVTGILASVQGKEEEMQKRYKNYNMHILSLHNKYALAFSCIILFFVGAPLGAIIRKGGLGLPMVIAIILFLIYYFIGVFAGNYAKENNIHPMLGAWMSTLIMLPLGIFLTKRATEDKGMVNFGIVTDFFKNLIKKRNKANDN
ncbi:LptF/LptG family permease [Maribacter sp. 2304DJ31-5]|uniref:LptF/LptG family permease n=1 Tax=Maribacter sp. 2304DJ31-5 TaxID=3386273 RepID=UPI0039BCA50D